MFELVASLETNGSEVLESIDEKMGNGCLIDPTVGEGKGSYVLSTRLELSNDITQADADLLLVEDASTFVA